MSTWCREWHPRSSSQRTNTTQQNHQSPSREQRLNRTRTRNKHPPRRLTWIYQHTPPTAPIADHSYIIIRWCCHRWPITRMWYPTKQGSVVSITNQLILKQPLQISITNKNANMKFGVHIICLFVQFVHQMIFRYCIQPMQPSSKTLWQYRKNTHAFYSHARTINGCPLTAKFALV